MKKIVGVPKDKSRDLCQCGHFREWHRCPGVIKEYKDACCVMGCDCTYFRHESRFPLQ